MSSQHEYDDRTNDSDPPKKNHFKFPQFSAFAVALAMNGSASFLKRFDVNDFCNMSKICTHFYQNSQFKKKKLHNPSNTEGSSVKRDVEKQFES